MNHAGDAELLTLIQSSIPVVERPFALMGETLRISEAEVIEKLERLKSQKIIRQISAIFDSRSLGYETSLVAARYDEAQLHDAVNVINHHPGVSHNYLRNHEFNVWYTIAVSPLSALGLERTVEVLHGQSGALSTRLLPTLRLFKIGVNFDVTGNTRPDDLESPRYSSDRNVAPVPLTAAEHQFVQVMQRDLPITPTPFTAYAQELGISLAQLRLMHSRFLDTGRMRRFAAVLHHRRAGFSANAMGVWQVRGGDRAIAPVGQMMAGFRAVSHCYQRPSYPDWPYNIFTMIHGTSHSECEQTLAAISAKTGIKQYSALYSTQEFKKVRVRYFTPNEAEWEQSVSAEPLLQR